MKQLDYECESVGEIIEVERWAALESFQEDLPGHRTLDELLALHVRQVVQTITHRPGGRTEVHTLVVGQRPGNDVQRFGVFYARGGRFTEGHR